MLQKSFSVAPKIPKLACLTKKRRNFVKKIGEFCQKKVGIAGLVFLNLLEKVKKLANIISEFMQKNRKFIQGVVRLLNSKSKNILESSQISYRIGAQRRIQKLFRDVRWS